MIHSLFWIIFTAYLRVKVTFAKDQCTRVIINFEYSAEFSGPLGDNSETDCYRHCEAASQGQKIADIAYSTIALDRWYDCVRDALCIYGDGVVPIALEKFIDANGPTEDSYMVGATRGLHYGITAAADVAGGSGIKRLFRSKTAKLRDFRSIANNHIRFCICKNKLEYIQFACDAYHGWGNKCDPYRFAQAHNHGNGFQVSLFTPDPGDVLGSVFPCFASQDDMSLDIQESLERRCTSFQWRILKIDYRNIQAEANMAMAAINRPGIP